MYVSWAKANAKETDGVGGFTRGSIFRQVFGRKSYVHIDSFVFGADIQEHAIASSQRPKSLGCPPFYAALLQEHTFL